MCGIGGLIRRSAGPVSADLQRMGQLMVHRGPDDYGFLLWSPGENAWRGRELPAREATVGFVHRRLSILDLTVGGWQPQSTEDGRYHIVYNGEIYNFLELKAELDYPFKSTSDTEVLLAALATRGPSVLSRLVGMFAFVLLDTVENTLLMARDPFGIKPLYYTQYRDGLAFASEIKALLELPGVSRELDPTGLYDYLRFGLTDHAETTLLAGVRQLPPGSFARVSLADLRPQISRYWEPRSAPQDLGYEESKARLRDLFEESIKLHLRADVPVGVALSGGIDSSSSTMMVRHLHPQGDLHTFSFVAENSPLSEEKWSNLVARASGSTVHTIKPGPGDLAEAMDSLVRAQDIPFGSTSIFASYMLMKLVQQTGIKVLISGQGADELLGGYDLFRGALMASLLRSGRLRQAFRLLVSMCRRPDWKAHLAHAAAFLVPPAWHGPLRRMAGRELMPDWLDAAWFAQRGVTPHSPLHYSGKRILTQELMHSLTYSSLPMLLRYEDRNSMAHSVESRVPFLTPQLAEFIYSLPETYIISLRGTTKAIFRDAMRGLVPDPILDRQDKIGFATPEKQWLSELKPLVRSVLGSPVLSELGALRVGRVRERCEKVLAGELRFDFTTWRLVNFTRWAEQVGARVS